MEASQMLTAMVIGFGIGVFLGLLGLTYKDKWFWILLFPIGIVLNLVVNFVLWR
jgi:hypothetical protein